MVNTKIRLTIIFEAKDGDDLINQKKQDLELTVTQIISSLHKIWAQIEESRENY